MDNVNMKNCNKHTYGYDLHYILNVCLHLENIQLLTL